MKISEIKDQKLRELAMLRRFQERLYDGIGEECDDRLVAAFSWESTPERGYFWAEVNQGTRTTI
jgi:hypothetical protein